MKRVENLKALIRVTAVLLVMTSVYYLAYQRTEQTSSEGVVTENTEKKKICVVIDAGQGGSRLRCPAFI